MGRNYDAMPLRHLWAATALMDVPTENPISDKSLSQWHKQPSSSTTAAHGEKFCRRSSPEAAAAVAALLLDDQRREETFPFYGGLAHGSHRNAFLSSSPVAESRAASTSPLVDVEYETWINTTTVQWTPWRTGDATRSPLADTADSNNDNDYGDIAAPAAPERASTGERLPGEARPNASNICRIEPDRTSRFSGAEASVTTVHDVCNKIISSGAGSSSSSSSSSNNGGSGGCGGQFSSGARSQTASGSCNGGGTVSAASLTVAAAAALGQPQQQQPVSHSKPCDYSSISVSSNSIRGGRPPYAASIAPPPPPQAVTATDASEPTPLLSDIDWTNATCLGGANDFTNTIIDDPHHLWLHSPTTSSTSSSASNNMAELERSLEAYGARKGATTTTTTIVETSIDCSNLLDELQVELAEPPVPLSSPVSLHEEIEQLSSSFDCDASNHLVARTCPYLVPDNIEPITPNILKWLQDDISGSAGQATLIDDGTLLLDDAKPFVHNLDRIHTLHGVGRVAPTTDQHPQRDHNYYAMKRRLQPVEGDERRDSKVPRLADYQHHPPPPTPPQDLDSWMATAAQEDVSFPAPAPTSKSVGLKRTSLASRKAAPTLVVTVAPKPPTTLLVAPAAPTLMTTTTTTTQHHDLPSLRLPVQAAMTTTTTLNTPDLTNDILDLEDGHFDLLSFIDTNDESLEFNAYQGAVEEKPALDLLGPVANTTPEEDDTTKPSAKRPTKPLKTETEKPTASTPQPLTLETLRLLTDATATTLIGSTNHGTTSSARSLSRRTNGGSSACSVRSSLSSASSACGDSSSDVSSSTTNAKTPKRRGRPPKVAGTVRDRAQYQHLSEADWRYREQRDKNNEASRKSRINRKDREQRLEQEAERLNAQHQKLSFEERHLRTECQRWRKAVMKLALL
uniref:BZIP domain-containing protein n=1 Tax=Anopheles farauti TaxID=69004 RepID=A0A182QFL6_9DIPT